jgi:hypothetical protein
MREIENPLNFVSNFAALSADDRRIERCLNQVAISDTARAGRRIDRHAEGQSAKVVQHGKRADPSSRTCCCIRAKAGDHRPPTSTR